MFNNIQIQAIKAALAANELGEKSPYQVSFAELGSSGASFGVCQGDAAANTLARSVLEQALRASQLDDVTVGRIVSALSQPCPNGSPLSSEDLAAVDNALSSPAGRALIDAMDNQLLQTVFDNAQQVVDAAAGKGWPLTPAALLYVALWVNMTGPPGLLCKWIIGQTVFGLTPPLGPQFADTDMETYLKRTSFFHTHPLDLDHLVQSVQTGMLVFQASAVA